MPPLVSVTVPTFNSSKTLAATLQSVARQSYSHLELIVADSHSKDSTVKIATDFGARVILTENKLLGARFDAFCHAKGECVLFLDSDQLLKDSTLERCVSSMKDSDMLALGESTLSPRSFVQRMFQADRILVNSIGVAQLNVVAGTMLPRFFRASILGAAFSRIPRPLFKTVIAHDHAIIYLEASKLSSTIGFLPDAIYSHEPFSLHELWSKNFRYGCSLVPLLRSPYWSFVWRKSRFRTGRQRLHGSRPSSALLLLKALPYLTGLGVGGIIEMQKQLRGRGEE